MPALARRFFAAVTAGDLDTVRAIYAPDAVVWHNTDGSEQSVDENLRVLAWVARNVQEFRYEDVRLQATESGFVQQHVTKGAAPNGGEFAMAACIVGTVVDGRITRIDEYLDSAQVTAMLGR